MTSREAGSLRRGAALLRHLATAGARGMALTELAARCGLPHPSVHRILKLLVDERLAEQNTRTLRYRLGPLAFELGLASSTSFDIRDVCVPAMQALAEATSDTIYLVGRSGFEAVCLHRIEGTYAIRTLVLEVGSRRPLGVGAGGLALLAALPAEERADVIERIGPALAEFGGLSPVSLRRACKRVETAGVSIIKGTVTLGVSAVGMAFRNSLGQPVAALSVAALSQRMNGERIREIKDHLSVACLRVEKALRSDHQKDWRTGRAPS